MHAPPRSTTSSPDRFRTGEAPGGAARPHQRRPDRLLREAARPPRPGHRAPRHYPRDPVHRPPHPRTQSRSERTRTRHRTPSQPDPTGVGTAAWSWPHQCRTGADHLVPSRQAPPRSRVRQPRRRRPDSRLLGPDQPIPTQSRRRPSTQPRTPHHRAHPQPHPIPLPAHTSTAGWRKAKPSATSNAA